MAGDIAPITPDVVTTLPEKSKQEELSRFLEKLKDLRKLELPELINLYGQLFKNYDVKREAEEMKGKKDLSFSQLEVVKKLDELKKKEQLPLSAEEFVQKLVLILGREEFVALRKEMINRVFDRMYLEGPSKGAEMFLEIIRSIDKETGMRDIFLMDDFFRESYRIFKSNAINHLKTNELSTFDGFKGSPSFQEKAFGLFLFDQYIGERQEDYLGNLVRGRIKDVKQFASASFDGYQKFIREGSLNSDFYCAVNLDRYRDLCQRAKVDVVLLKINEFATANPFENERRRKKAEQEEPGLAKGLEDLLDHIKENLGRSTALGPFFQKGVETRHISYPIAAPLRGLNWVFDTIGKHTPMPGALLQNPSVFSGLKFLGKAVLGTGSILNFLPPLMKIGIRGYDVATTPKKWLPWNLAREAWAGTKEFLEYLKSSNALTTTVTSILFFSNPAKILYWMAKTGKTAGKMIARSESFQSLLKKVSPLAKKVYEYAEKIGIKTAEEFKEWIIAPGKKGALWLLEKKEITYDALRDALSDLGVDMDKYVKELDIMEKVEKFLEKQGIDKDHLKLPTFQNLEEDLKKYFGHDEKDLKKLADPDFEIIKDFIKPEWVKDLKEKGLEFSPELRDFLKKFEDLFKE